MFFFGVGGMQNYRMAEQICRLQDGSRAEWVKSSLYLVMTFFSL